MSKSPGFLWIDIEGHSLTSEDREILEHPAVSGIILFSKNYESLEQLKQLTKNIHKISPDVLISADQEGGRVQRFVTQFTQLPSMDYWGRQYLESNSLALQSFSDTLKTMVTELRQANIYSTLAPVLDINYQRNTVIGERSFGDDPELIITLGEFFIAQLNKLKMPVMGKHFPGHGWVQEDSHDCLPVDDRSFDEIKRADLQVFSRLSAQLDAIMPAHIVYSSVDPLPVAFSSHWLRTVLRNELNFQGLIVSDDLTMQGAAFLTHYEDRARLALDAGCDVLIVCRSRAGVIEVLDRVKKPVDSQFSHRMSRYSRFLR